MRIRTRRAGLAGAVAVGFALATAPLVPAQAAVPSCISVKVNDYKRYDAVTVYNNCSTTYNIKVVWAYETDQCLNVVRGSYATSYRDFPARFDGLQSC